MSQKAVCAKHTHLSHPQAGSGGFAATVGIEDVGIKARSCACFKAHGPLVYVVFNSFVVCWQAPQHEMSNQSVARLELLLSISV